MTFKTSVFSILVVCIFSLAALGRAGAADATYVRFNTTFGSIDVQLLSDEAPLNVTNFLSYVDSGAYNGSFIHRSLSVATSGLGIFQGGGYEIKNNQILAIPANAPVANEFDVSNTRGTLAMALTGTDINSATNQWFFNDVDNSAALDPQSFTVFGRVANNASLAVMDALAAITPPNPPLFNPPLDALPLINYNPAVGVTVQNFLYVNSIVREAAPVAATVSLSNLAVTFNGSAQKVAVTTTPGRLTTLVTYNGSFTAPSAVGSYAVSASITSPGYAGNATGTLVISAPSTKLMAKVTLGNLSATYNGTAKAATATTNPPGLNVTFTYNGSATAPTAAGSYPVVATINDLDYQGVATGTLVIAKAPATATLGNLAVTYNTSPQSATATTTPSGLDVTFTYNGSATPPTNAGSYAVVGTISDPNYQGSVKGTLVIGKATATVTLGNLAATYNGTVQPATVTTSPVGLPVTFTYNGSGRVVPNAAGSYTVVGTINNANYAGSATGTLVIGQGTATVTLGSLAAIYNGKSHAATATTVPAKLTVTFTYNGSAIAPTLVGSYTVVGTVNNVDYAGSATSTLVISPIVPVATTTTPIPGALTAMLNGTTNPEGAATTVSFQYGTTTAYTNTTPGQSVAAGTATVPFSAAIGSLLPQTIYHYRAVATNTATPALTAVGADKTFTTLAVPVFGTSPAAYLGASGAEVGFSVNPNGVATSVSFQYSTSADFSTFLTTATQSIGSGKVPVNVFALFPGLAANTTYYFRMVTTGAAGTFMSDPGTFTTLPFDTTLVAKEGDFAVGTSGPTFAAFGNPAVNVSDDVAFAGTLTLATGVTAANDSGIWIDLSGTRQLIAQIDSPAPGTAANFLTLGDPVFNNNEAVAFRGTLNVSRALSATATGIWKGTTAGDLALVAQQGGSAPGTTGTFNTFTSLGLSDAGGVVLFATLNTATGITAANNVGIWEGNTTGDLALVLRLGGTVGGKTITGLTFLPTETIVNGQTRSFESTSGDLVCGATLNDNTTHVVNTGVVTVVGGTSAIAVLSGSPADAITGATFASFGSPAINTNDHLAFAATLTNAVGGVTTSNNLGIWADNSSGARQLIARIGSGAPGTAANFLTLGDPVYNNNEAVAFRGTLNVARTLSATATGIWCTGANASSPALMAQQGGPAPGCPTGATFSAFTGLALADQGGATNKGGVILLATLNANTAAAVTTANNLGIWAVDTTGALQLIVRTGDILNGKTVTGLAFLPALGTVNGQSRSFAQGNGDLVYLATFSDKSTAIFNVVFP